MAGKPQKALGALQDQRENRVSRRGAALFPVTDQPRPIPPCPTGLHKTARLWWRSFWLSPAGAVTRYEAHEAALRHWITCVSERAHTEESIAKEPIVKGSMEQDTMNPLLAYQKELNRKIEKYEEAFGMTPLAAVRLNIATVQHAASVHDLTRRLDRGREERAEASEAEVIDLGALG